MLCVNITLGIHSTHFKTVRKNYVYTRVNDIFATSTSLCISFYYLSNRKYERLCGLLGEKVTVFVQKKLHQNQCHNDVPLIPEIGNRCHAGRAALLIGLIKSWTDFVGPGCTRLPSPPLCVSPVCAVQRPPPSVASSGEQLPVWRAASPARR